MIVIITISNNNNYHCCIKILFSAEKEQRAAESQDTSEQVNILWEVTGATLNIYFFVLVFPLRIFYTLMSLLCSLF